ncbi:MAG: hypothetical protein ACM3ZV_05405 [Bacillota bacterium]
MRTMTKLLAGAAGLAAIATAAPAAAQYYPGYSNYSAYSTYNSYSPYSSYGYSSYAMNPSVAAQQCTAAVQSRLYNRTSLASILGSLVGIPTNSYGQVVGITSTTPTRSGMRIRGIATSGRYAYNGYSPYGMGAYGALGYNTAASADLSWRCDVDYRGYVRDVDINRRY